jgi:Ca-activated chloride channel homolog
MRKLRRVYLVSTLLGALTALPVPAGAGPPGVLPGELRVAQPNASRFPEISLYAYPIDSRGTFISGLGPSDFHVLEDRREARVLSVESSGATLDICLTLDCSLSMVQGAKLEAAKSAAAQFVGQLGTDDRAGLISFADRSVLHEALSADHSRLSGAIAGLQPSGSSTAFFDGVYWSIAQVAVHPDEGGSVLGVRHGRSDARRVVVALTDGNDLSSRVTAEEVAELARANGVSLCMIALGRDAATAPLRFLAQETGGAYMEAPGPQDLQRLYAALAQQLKREYRITFATPRPERDGGRREVRLSLSQTPVAADTWYQAPGQGSLLVTVPTGPIQGEGVAASGDSAPVGASRLPPGLAVGLLLMVGGLALVIVTGALWLAGRRGRVPIADSNPRVDLLPLWISGRSMRVGRGEECELVLDSDQVSRVHARIEALQGGFRLIDQGSRNGTFVNGRKVRNTRELRVGDVVRFGDREFRFAGELPA